MSHVETAKTKIMDLECLKKACEDLGLTFVENKKEYEWWGRHVGDYPVPEGFKKEDLGKCEHVIQVPGAKYEIGVVASPDGKGHALLFDFYGHSGQPILDALGGKELPKLVDRYSVAVLKKQARAKGYFTTESVVKGKITLTVTGFA